jgi:hypothetical protein
MNSRAGVAVPLTETLCANPVQTTMIGLGIVGLAWLALGRSADRAYRPDRPGRQQREEENGADAAGGPTDRDEPSSAWPLDHAWTGESANGYSPGLSYGEADLLRGLVRAESDLERESIRSRLRQYWHSASRQMRRSAWTGQDRIRYWLEANPLLIGAAAAVIGAAVGSAIGAPGPERVRR